MTDITYEQVVQLADQLSPEDQVRLAEHLEMRRTEEELSDEAWESLFEDLKISVPITDKFSLRREDWYDDE
ncbi:MAG: hypothetical protein KF726_23390 [Anaerolineae bacterium]|nr:hypothetical protein [Anaerolineae bacterium]